MIDRTDAVRFAKSLLVHKDLHSAAISHGKAYESVAVKKYEDLTGCITEDCCIFICQQHPYLAASPDRVVNDQLLLEVKCPYTALDEMITHDTVPCLKKEKDNLALNQHDDYYYQVQGQMLCTDAKAVDFVVYTFKDIQIFRVCRNDQFLSDMVQKLSSFLMTTFLMSCLTNSLLNVSVTCSKLPLISSVAPS